MNWRAVKAIVRKDLKAVFRSKGVVLPLILVPLIMLVLMPGLAAIGPALDVEGAELSDILVLTESMPASLQAELAGLETAQVWVVVMIIYQHTT